MLGSTGRLEAALGPRLRRHSTPPCTCTLHPGMAASHILRLMQQDCPTRALTAPLQLVTPWMPQRPKAPQAQPIPHGATQAHLVPWGPHADPTKAKMV